MALAERQAKPAKQFVHKEPSTDGEFRNVFGALEKVHLGPFRFFYDEALDALFLQVRDNTNTQQYVSIVRIESQTGDIYIRGTVFGSAGDGVGHAGRL